MSALVGLFAALGVLLIYDGVTRPALRRRSTDGALAQLGRAAGIKGLTPARLAAALAGSALLAGVLLAALSASPVIAGAGALAAPVALVSWLGGRARRRRRRLSEAWPDAIAVLIASVRAGVPLPEACVALAARGPAELAPGFAAFAATYRATGSFGAALERLRSVLADPVGDRVAVALKVARDVGGTELVRLLRTLGDLVRADLRVRKEIEARWSWTVTAARVAAAAPWMVLVIMAARPEAARAYSSPAGALLIGLGGAATLVGYRLMLRAARLPEDRRLAA